MNCTHWMTLKHSCLTVQAQASLMLCITYYLTSRQGKSLDCEWASILDVVVFRAPYGELNWQGAESEKFLQEKIWELIDETLAETDTTQN